MAVPDAVPQISCLTMKDTDRHFNNLGIIVNSVEDTFRPAPIFDNGNALLSDWERFGKEKLQDNIEKVIGQPFAANLEIQANTAGIGLKINYRKLAEALKGMPQSRGLDVLKYQLDRYQEIIPDVHTKTKNVVVVNK